MKLELQRLLSKHNIAASNDVEKMSNSQQEGLHAACSMMSSGSSLNQSTFNIIVYMMTANLPLAKRPDINLSVGACTAICFVDMKRLGLLIDQNIQSLFDRITQSPAADVSAFDLKNFFEQKKFFDKKKKLTQDEFDLVMKSNFPVSGVLYAMESLKTHLRTSENLRAALMCNMGSNAIFNCNSQTDFNKFVFDSCTTYLRTLNSDINNLANGEVKEKFQLLYAKLNALKENPLIQSNPISLLDHIDVIFLALRITESQKKDIDDLRNLRLRILDGNDELWKDIDKSILSLVNENYITHVQQVLQENNVSFSEKFNNFNEDGLADLSDCFSNMQEIGLLNKENIESLVAKIKTELDLKVILELDKLSTFVENPSSNSINELRRSIYTCSTQADFNKVILNFCNKTLDTWTKICKENNDSNPQMYGYVRNLRGKLREMGKTSEFQKNPSELLHAIYVISYAVPTSSYQPTQTALNELAALSQKLKEDKSPAWKTIGLIMMALGAAIAVAAGIALTVGSVGIATPLGVGVAVAGGVGLALVVTGFFARSNKGMNGISENLDRLQQSLPTPAA